MFQHGNYCTMKQMIYYFSINVNRILNISHTDFSFAQNIKKFIYTCVYIYMISIYCIIMTSTKNQNHQLDIVGA